MKNIYYHFFLLILITLQSCTFEPKGEEFVELDSAGVQPDIQVNLNLPADTLFIPSGTNITFVYGLKKEAINWAQFSVNGVHTNPLKIETNTVSLSRTFNESAGQTLSLEIKIFTRSQTGSIADKLDAEGSLISREWTIVILSTTQLSPNITKADFVDGSFKFEWNKFKGMGFMNYKVYKSMAQSHKGFLLLTTINSREQTSFIDTAYCGEETEYYVKTNDKYSGTSTSRKGPIPVLTAENTAKGELLFKWTKPPYSKNLKGYRISYFDSSGTLQQMAEISDVTSESFLITNPSFAHFYKLYLTPLSKTNNYYDQSSTIYYLSTSAGIYLGEPVPKYYHAVTGQGSMIYLIDQSQQITLFDPIKFTTARQIKKNESIQILAVSPDDQYLVTCGSSPQKIYFENLSDPSKSKTLDLSAALPRAIIKISISNAGTGVLMNNNKSVLYDYINELKLAEFDLSGPVMYSDKISPSGNFFYLDTYSNCYFYQYKDNKAILLESGINQSNDFLFDCYFIPGKDEKMLRVYRNRIELMDCNTWTIEQKWLFPNLITHAYNFDIKSSKLLLSVDTKMVLFDVINGTQEEIAPIDNSIYNSTSLFYNNGYLLWGEGTAYKKN